MPQPPITQLRPLHSLQQSPEQHRPVLSSGAQTHREDDAQLLYWQSSLELTPKKDIYIKAFVKLASRVMVLDPGEPYCIQDTARGGYLLAHSASAGRENYEKDASFEFVPYTETQNIITDFSIGRGKALQLHVDEVNETVQLAAQANIIPAVALNALGRMLDDIILELRQEPRDGKWTQPSVLNFPPKSRPLPLLDNDANEPALLHQWFEKRVLECPKRTALDFLVSLENGTRVQYTYQQVDNAANALSAELLRTFAQQAQSHSFIKTVAVQIGPCPELYISYLAALKAGIAFCPIPVDAPAERKQALMDDLKPGALLMTATTEQASLSLSSSASSIVAINVAAYLAKCDVKSERQPEQPPTTENDVAYILYTSGTTGMPKGVTVSHISAACTISALSAHYGFVPPASTSSDQPTRWFQGAAPTFDISLFEIFWTLSTGSTLCCAPRDFTLQNIDKVVTALQADITNITPSFASLLDPVSIRGLMVGGETLNARLVRDFARYNIPASVEGREHVPTGIYNGYGPTETAIYCVAQARVPEEQRGSVIGTPLETCGVLVVDIQSASLTPVPMGAVGELVITGPQVSRAGYLNRPDETARAFVDDLRWGRAYRTGDRARVVWSPQDKPVIEFLGRISDDQVKLSGRRVELGEIESVLASKVDGVRETLACVWKQQNSKAGSEKIISLVVLEPHVKFEFDHVHQKCLETAAQNLPDYMRPFKTLQVEALPRSASGKVDRKAASVYLREALRESHKTQLEVEQEVTQHTAPLSDPEDAALEEELLSIVTHILCDGSSDANSRITATTPLIQAGMDSLHAMRLLRDVRQQCLSSDSAAHQCQGARLQPSLARLLDSGATVRSVFFPPTQSFGDSAGLSTNEVNIRSQLADFSSKYVSEAVSKLNLTDEADIEMVLPATNTQSQLAMSFAMDKRNYISHSILRLKPGVVAGALKEAAESVVSAQAIYRCAMLPSDDSLSPFTQVILTPEAWRSFTHNSRRIVHSKASVADLAGDPKRWLDVAEKEISLDAQRLYHIQVIESDSDSKPDSPDTGLLLISAAHCICDGASLDTLISDIARQYAGLEPLPKQGIYEAVFEWVSGLSSEIDELWRNSLKGWETESFGALSGCNIKPSANGMDSERGMIEYVSDLPWKALEDKSRALGASPLSIIQASWAVLLSLFSEADTGDVTFGSVISGHHFSAHAPTFSVVPCRVALPEMQTVGELFNSLVDHSRFAQAHRHTSFGIFKSLPYNTALALQAYQSNELGDTGSLPWTEIHNPAIRYDFDVFVEVFPTDPHNPIRNEQFDNMTFKLTYREDALSKLSASCIANQLVALMKTMLNSLPDELVQSLPARLPRDLLSAEGTVQVPTNDEEEINRQIQDRVELLHSQFENQAVSTPDLLALSFYTSLDSSPIELSYAELDARANGLSKVLREEDVDIIPICMQRSVELYVSILAILKSGSAWCPIDDTSPLQRRTSLIARTKSKLLLTTTESLPLVEPCLEHESLEGMRVILVDRYADEKTSVRAYPRESIRSSRSLNGRDLAYLLWTSGTTGEPKGVMIQHNAAAEAMRDLQIQVEHDKKAGQVRTLQLSAYSFDVFVQDLFYTWGLAGSVISGTRELVLGTFVEFIWQSRPTHAHLTPSFGASIAVEEIRGSTLQYVTFIGEKLTEDVAEAWAAPGITTRAYNTYGPAENAVVSTMRQFYGKSRDQAKAANVGFPLTKCTSYVVREVSTGQDMPKRWELVPRYGVGELALGGAQVAKGYLSNEAKTAKSFIQGGPGIKERIYLTGDMVRLNDHGFEFLGRNDDLVKITGIRIELSEISAACASVKDEESAVEHVETLYLERPGSKSGSNTKVVVTFVSVKKEAVDTSKIRSQVFQRARDMLPTYMVPGHVVVLDTTMPRTASNKVDRKALQEIYKSSDLNVLAGRDASEQSASDGQQGKPHWTEEQRPILQAIADNFKVPIEPLSPADGLAGLGFSSLEITKLAWSLRRQLKCAVGVLDLMRCQDLGELVDVVLSKLPDQSSTLAQGNDKKPLEAPTESSWITTTKDLLTKSLRGEMRPHDTSYILPATPMQESLIVETLLEPRAYWSHRVFDLSHLTDIDGQRLKKAWIAAAKRFDILRTIFVPLAQLDLKHTDEYDNSTKWARKQGIQSTILQLVREEPRVHWNLIPRGESQSLPSWAEKLQLELAPTTTAQPPWSVTFAEESGKVMLSMHHALHDSVSSEILLDTVAKLYLKQKAPGYSDLAQLARGMELGLLPTASQRQEAATLWNNRLSELRDRVGALNGSFPDLTQSRQKQPERILMSRRAIPASFLTLAAGSPALPTVFQSAFGCVLASYLELKAIMLGQTVSQRILHPDLAHVMGPAMMTLPVIVRTDAASCEELWSDMARDSTSLIRTTHNLHPVDIKKMLNQGTESSNAPFPGLFVYHPAPENAENTEKNTGEDMFREVEQALSLNVEHPLAFNIFEGDGAMELTGNGRNISQAQLDLMLDQILEQARAMLHSPEVPIYQLQNKMGRSLISVSSDVISENTCPVDPTGSVSFHASNNPEWIAAEQVVFQDSDELDDEIVTKTITYAQLDKLTNTIGSKMASHDAHLQPDDVVAMYLGRDIKSLAATLAIFRSGYVYLPVDEELPAARKQLLIRDANAKLIITTEKLAGDLDLHRDDGPPALILPDGDDDVDAILSWPAYQATYGARDGGYLLYTSGSTGRPKGVRVSNSNLCHFIASFSARLIEFSPATGKLGGAGKYLNLTSRAFDPHLTQLFVPWHLGYRVVIGKDRNTMLGSLQQVINDLGITHFGSVPSVLTQLRLRPEDVPSVRVVTTGGEKASSELLDAWTRESNSTGQGVTLFNFYGPTEVTIGCLGHAVNRDSNARNLGLPLQGLEALLLCPDTGDEQVIARRGQPGELCIAGPQVAMGYLNRPMETALSFRSTSLLGGGNKKIYKTGDMMRMMHDGTLEFLGRADQQAKIRGQRLELDEVVSFLKHAAADEGDLDFAAAVVSSGTDASVQQQQLFGFVSRTAKALLKGEINSEVELLQSQGQAVASLLQRIEQKCEAGLPAFMVPTMLWVSKIPYLTASGKVDTKLLSKLANDFYASQQSQSHRTEPPSATTADPVHALDARECIVVAAVEEAIGSKIKATSTSSIHRLGIDSLSAVHLVSLLRKRGFPTLNMADILSSSCTVGSIARLVSQEFDSNALAINESASTLPHEKSSDRLQQVRTLSLADLGPIPAGLEKSRIEAVLPCLPLQSALIARSLVWLSANDEGCGGKETVDVPYVAQFHYRLSRDTDIVRWKDAVRLLVGSEAMLRTCFIQREDDGQIFQVILRSHAYLPFDGSKDPIEMVAHMNVQPPIVFQIGDTQDSGETHVSLKIHHALFDGAAIGILRKRIEQYYDGQGPVSPSVHKSLDILKGMAAHCHLSNTQIESTKEFWQTRLQGVRPCRVGIDEYNNLQGNMARLTMPFGCTSSHLKSSLKAQSQKSGVSISVSTAFQLATALCLAQLTRQASVVYGFVMSLRPLLGHVADGVDHFIGPCINTLVQTLKLEGGSQTLAELAQTVHESHTAICQGTMPLVSVENVQRWSGSEDRLFDTLLSINLIPAEDELSGEPGRMSSLRVQSKSDLALAIDVDLHADGKISLMLSSAGALTESQLANVGQLFEKIVCNSAKDTRVDDFVQVQHNMDMVTNDHQNTNCPEISETETADERFQGDLALVHASISRLLRIKSSDISTTSKTSLYQLGLDSITILPFVKLINKSENIKLAPNAILKARTLHGVARLVQEAKKANSISNDSKTQHSEVKHRKSNINDKAAYDTTLSRVAKGLMFVATPLQEGMLSASLAIEGRAYTYLHTIQLSKYALQADTPSLDNFFAAIGDTVQACEILRTRFIFTQDDEAPWIGIISPTEQSDLVNWEVVNSGSPGKVQLRIHHALYDATSIQAIWRILRDNYCKRLRGHNQNGTEATQYLFRPFARTVGLAQRTSVTTWGNLLQDYHYTPVEFLSDSLQASSAFHFKLDENQLSILQTRCRELSVTTKAALQLAWVKVLTEALYGQADVVYGEVISTGGGFADDSDSAVLGPTINTIPMRVKLADKGTTMNISEALVRIQKLNDDARGANAMASLRAVQTQWRSSNQSRDNIPSNLFQSLFVFDGTITSEETKAEDPAQSLFKPIQAQANTDNAGPAYDDYPLIVSFQIKNNTLYGKVRAKMTPKEVETLGSQLETAVRSIVSQKLESPALDTKQVKSVRKRNEALISKARNEVSTLSSMDIQATTADAVVEVVKAVLGPRCEGKDIGYNTKLVHVGLDSILAIRLSKLLRKQAGLNVSVFEIMKGSSVYDIVQSTVSTQKVVLREQKQQLLGQDDELREVAAKVLGLESGVIQSVVPALTGQRAHLEQWLYNGKRFFEAPWVYRVIEDSINADRLSRCWAELCQIHEVLRTTFIWTGNATEIVQVTLGEQWTGEGNFTALQDFSKPIQALMDDHVSQENNKPSNLREPPARISFLEGLDGKAVVLRLHHALYDAWSIKMIEKDLNDLLAVGKVLQSRTPLVEVVHKISNMRQPNAEISYWSHHLLKAQDTVLHADIASMADKSPLGPHSKFNFSDIIPQKTMDMLAQNNSNTRISSAIILAYARTLKHFTKRSRPTFGLNHASRSVSSSDGTETLDLTAESIPTLTMTPFSMVLDSQSPEPVSEEHLLDSIQDHLAQLTKFAQSDIPQSLCPKFNSYLNILYPGGSAVGVDDGIAKVLSRYRLHESLASSYFTITQPSASIVSTIEELDTSHLCPHRLFLNVIVRQGQGINVAVSCDQMLFGTDSALVTKLVSHFGSELSKITDCLDAI